MLLLLSRKCLHKRKHERDFTVNDVLERMFCKRDRDLLSCASDDWMAIESGDMTKIADMKRMPVDMASLEKR